MRPLHRLNDTRLWLWLFRAAALFAFVMGVVPHPPRLPGEPSDKVQHIVAFLTLGLLGSRAYPRTAQARILAGLALFGALIEIIQSIPALHRDSDVTDWVADIAATGVALLLVRAWRRWRRRDH